jgi:8-oxo-dGTP pyrophosphatase MutT (NUDIX family)
MHINPSAIQVKLLHALPGLEAQMLMAPPVRRKSDMPSSNVRLGGVLILLYPKNKVWHVLLMERTSDGGVHSGQISFPGGKYEPNDYTITYTAMRECKEEMGTDFDSYKILGGLTPLFIPPSNFYVTPLLAVSTEVPLFKPSIQEVKHVLEVPLSTLFANEHKDEQEVYRSDDNTLVMRAPVYKLPTGEIIWGATAMMLSELEVLLKQTL